MILNDISKVIALKNQIVKKSQKKDETFVFDCIDKSDSFDQLINVLGSQDLFSSDKLIIVKNINKLLFFELKYIILF